MASNKVSLNKNKPNVFALQKNQRRTGRRKSIFKKRHKQASVDLQASARPSSMSAKSG